MTNYMPYPCFLLKSALSSSARELYALLLHRANLSRFNKWIDDHGRIFLIYTLEQLSRDLGKSKTTIKSALNELCARDLLDRKRHGKGLANYLYVKLPAENLMPTVSLSAGSPDVSKLNQEDSSPSIPEPEIRPPDGRKSDHNRVGKLTPSKKKEKKDKSYLKRRFRDYSYKEGESL